MKKFLLFIAIINWFSVKSQNLVVGFSNPNEIISLTSGTYNYDTLYILNNGELNLSGQVNFSVNNIIAIINSGRLNVKGGYFTANNLIYMQDSAVINITDTVNLQCSLFLTGNSFVKIDSAVVNIPMTYKGQYSWAANQKAGISVDYSQCNLGTGALGGNFTDSSFFYQHKTNYLSSILPMTMGITGNTSLTVDSCSGGMELVISQEANVDINKSDFFVIWFTFDDGDTVDYSYPSANSVIPNASNIIGDYYFSDSLQGVSGIDFSVHISNSDIIFWGIISRQNSVVTINNSVLIACGFYFSDTTINTANGFIDSQNYTSYQAPFSDRYFRVNNTTVEAWNFYPVDSSQIIIDSCIYGESLGFNNSITIVKNSTCDGSGGYFGGTNNSKTVVYNSQIIRTSGSQQIINFQEYAKAWFFNSTILGTSVINDNSQMFFANCKYDSIPVVNNNAYFAEAWLDSLNNCYTDSIINITGRINGINGSLNSSKITRYIIRYSLPDTSNFVLLKDTLSTNFNIINQILAKWNTTGVSTGNYLIWLTLFVDGDSAISCNRNVFLDNYSNLSNRIYTNKITVYPNPTNGNFTINLANNPSEVFINITNISGQIIKSEHFYNQNKINIDFDEKAGIYFLEIITNGQKNNIKLIKN